ncbi:MAG: tetratricopeptide repeat protein [Oligoflexales bacterium]|nr:tetratricopeptide repeat protein [Oligoflexales bacterium]
MSGNKIERKDLKRPDAFQVKVFQGFEYIAKNKKFLSGLASSIIVLVIISFGIKYLLDFRDNKRKVALSEIHSVYDKEKEGADKEKEVIQKEIDQLSKPAPSDTGNDKTDKIPDSSSKISELKNKLTAIVPNHEVTMKKYYDFFKENPKSPEGWAAAVRYASNLVEQKKNEEAVSVLESVLSNSKSHILYNIEATILLVNILEDMGKYDDAIAKIDSLTKISPKELKPRILLTKGRIQLEKKDSQGAKATFDILFKEHATTREADQARGLIIALSE